MRFFVFLPLIQVAICRAASKALAGSFKGFSQEEKSWGALLMLTLLLASSAWFVSSMSFSAVLLVACVWLCLALQVDLLLPDEVMHAHHVLVL